jgi:hypothetical protein
VSTRSKCGKENADHYDFCLGCGDELPRGPAIPPPPSTHPKVQRLSKYDMDVLIPAIPCLVIGAVFAVLGGIPMVKQTLIWRDLRENASWPRTSGTVSISQVVRVSPSGRISTTHYKARVVYHYSVGGQRYTSRNIGFGFMGGNGISRDLSANHVAPTFPQEKPARELAARYPVGKVVTVYYRPTDPALACLDPRAPPLIELIFGEVFLLGLGLLSLGVGIRQVLASHKPDL